MVLNGKEILLNLMKTSFKRCEENGNKGYILEVDIEYSKNLHDLYSDLSFLPERMKIKKCNKIVCKNKQTKTTILALKQALNQGLVLKKP